MMRHKLKRFAYSRPPLEVAALLVVLLLLVAAAKARGCCWARARGCSKSILALAVAQD